MQIWFSRIVALFSGRKPADRDLIKRLHDAGANRVIVRTATTKSEPEMVAELTRIADAVIR